MMLRRVSALLLLIAALTGFVLSQKIDPTRPTARICYLPRATASPTSAFLISRFTAAYLQNTYTAYNWNVIPIANNVNKAVRDMVGAIVTFGDNCDVILGPGSSSYSVAASPIIATPWLDFASTSVELSDKSVHPWFNRVLTSDAQIGGAMANVLLGFQWKHVNVISSAESYGTSVSQQLILAFTSAGGTVTSTQSLQVGAAPSDVVDVFDAIERTSRSRIVAVGIPSGSTLQVSFINVTMTYKLYQRYVFLFSEAMCSGNTLWRVIPGALCVTFKTYPDLVAPFLTAYNARNITDDQVAISQYGGTVTAASVATTFSVFGAFAHDATLHVLRTLNASLDLSNRTDVLARLRTTTTDGFTGLIALNAAGDRTRTVMQLLNTDHSQNEISVALLNGNDLALSYNTTTGAASQVLWFGSYYSSSPPTDTVSSSFQIEAWMIILAACCIVSFLLITFALCVAKKNRAAFQRFIGSGLQGHVANAAVTIGVLIVKILVGANMYFDRIGLGYLISYYIVIVLSIIAMLVEVVNRARYVVKAMTADEGIGFDEEMEWQSLILYCEVITMLLSDVPSLVIASSLIVSGVSNIEWIVVLAALAGIVTGMKLTNIPTLFKHILTRHDAEDDVVDDAVLKELTDLAADHSNPLIEVAEVAAMVRSFGRASVPAALGDMASPSGIFEASRRESNLAPVDSTALPIEEDEKVRARRLAFLHAGALKDDGLRKRTLVRIYIPELLKCVKLRVEHLALLFHAPQQARSNSASVPPSPHGSVDLRVSPSVEMRRNGSRGMSKGGWSPGHSPKVDHLRPDDKREALAVSQYQEHDQPSCPIAQPM